MYQAGRAEPDKSDNMIDWKRVQRETSMRLIKRSLHKASPGEAGKRSETEKGGSMCFVEICRLFALQEM